MATTIKIKHSTTAGNAPSSLQTGELAINVADGNLFYGDGSGVSQDFTVGTLTAEQYVISSSVTYMTQSFSSGSTIFGDTQDDTHQFTGSVNITGSFIVDGIQFPTADGDNGDTLITDGAGTLSFARPTVYANVKNVSGGELVKGTPVHASSSVGNANEVIKALASDSTTMPAHFILNETLADEAEGLAIAIGYINGVDTSAFNEGDTVYVGADGGYVNVKPTGSNLIQNLGIVTKVDANGSGYVLGAGRSNDVPNISPGYAWVGNSDSVATAVATSSFAVDTANTASYVAAANIDGTVATATVAVSAISAGSATTATTATNASYVNVASITADQEYGVVFRDGSSPGNQQLYADSEEDTPSWNPSTNVFTTPNLVATNFTASNNISASGTITAAEYVGLPSGLISSSAQIDHDSTTNFSSDEHFTQANITTVGTVTSGDVSAILPSGLVSGSATVTTEYNATGLSSAGEYQIGARLALNAYGTNPASTAGTIVSFGTTGVNAVGAQSAAAAAKGRVTVVTDAADGDELILEGVVKMSTNTGWSTAKKGSAVYMSTTAGQVTTTVPSTSGDYVRIMGHVVDASNAVIYFNPENGWIEIA